MPATVLPTAEPIPTNLRNLESGGWHVTCHKSTYAANDPSEDRSTVVIDPAAFVFAGVWDGHGGVKASDFAEANVWPNFQAALAETGDVAEAFRIAYAQTDVDYIKTGRERQDPSMLLTGTCAVGAHVDLAQRKVVVGNLGDSRAVLGVYSDDYVTAVDMSTDHSATIDSEKFRLRSEHPMDSDIIVEQYDEWKEDYDCVVKGVTRFSRSIGDAHMKDKTCAKLFNSYRCGVTIDPVPRKVPYITNRAEVKEQEVENGFIIIACDGIWDEMTSDEAVHLCHHLQVKHQANPEVNIADEFLHETLKKATARLRRTDPDETELTVEALKARPQGKAGRSQLHDDLTCVILCWRSTAAKPLRPAGARGGWSLVKKTVDMHTEIKHRKKLKWARLMDDMMLMVRQEREGQPSTLTQRILSEGDAEDAEEEDEEEGEEADAGGAVTLKARGQGGGVDLTRAVVEAASAAEAAAKAATSADLVGRSGDPDVMRAAAQAANAAAAAANTAAQAAAAAAAAASTTALACEAMARACGVDLQAAVASEQEAKD